MKSAHSLSSTPLPCRVQKNRRRQACQLCRFGGNKLASDKVEGSHKVTHTLSEQTGGLTELLQLEQDEKNQPWQGGTSACGAGEWSGGGRKRLEQKTSTHRSLHDNLTLGKVCP